MSFGTRKYVSRSNLRTNFQFTFICCHIPHEYLLLVYIFDAVFSHLSLTNGCTLKKG